MTLSESTRKQLLSLCDAPDHEDGVDPRKRLREPYRKVKNRKALQLCHQVAETLNGVLAGECGDDLLRSLLVETVVPAPDSSRLLVTVCLSAEADDVATGQVLEHLQRASGWLRSEVAAAIHRKRAPELIYRAAAR